MGPILLSLYKRCNMRYYQVIKNGKQRVIQVPDGFLMTNGFNRFKPNDEQVARYLTRYGYTNITKVR